MYGVNCCEEDVYSYRGMRSVFEGESPEFEGTELLSRLNLRLLVNQEEKDSMHVYEGQRARILLEKADSNKELSYNVVYISPVRHAEGSVFLNNVLEDPELYEEMIEILREYDEGIVSINYDTKNEAGFNRGIYKVLSRTSRKALPLNVYGDGMKKAILLMSAVVKAKNGILLLDEFETAIHTSAMNKTFHWILRTCRKLNVQVFLTSHSKEAIDKVLKCAPEIQDDIALYTLYRGKEGTLVRKIIRKRCSGSTGQYGIGA